MQFVLILGDLFRVGPIIFSFNTASRLVLQVISSSNAGELLVGTALTLSYISIDLQVGPFETH